jgi:hypothetical protein
VSIYFQTSPLQVTISHSQRIYTKINFVTYKIPKMSNLDPKGSSQPTQRQAYETEGNPASKEPAERQNATANASANKMGHTISTRSENDTESDPTPSSLANGIHGAPAGEEAKGQTEESMGRHNELDAEQMAAPGEGKVAAAVNRKSGASGGEQGLESDLDRKKKEQAPLREANEEKRESNVDVSGVLGQRGGPASTVD